MRKNNRSKIDIIAQQYKKAPYTYEIKSFLSFTPLNTKKKTMFHAGIVEHSVSFDTHGSTVAANQLKDFLNGIAGE